MVHERSNLMPPAPKTSLTKSAWSAYLCICIALLLLLGLGIWSAYEAVRHLRTTLLQAEVSRLRSHAARTVGRIERDLEQRAESTGLEDIDRGGWLEQHWAEFMPHERERLYAAIIDAEHTIVHHSEPNRTGRQLENQWYERVVLVAGEDVVQTQSPVLAAGEPAYDVRVPIIVNHREVGEYHVGFNVAWLDQWVETQRNLFLRQRVLIGGGILFIVLLATTSLFRIATHAVRLRRAITETELNRATEVAQLAAGLAHEIRNPMHALRINLHALAKVDDQRRLKLPPEDHRKLLEESNREIQRVEQLMQELVNFASPDDPRDEVVDLKSEVQSTIDFIDQELLRHEIKIQTHFPTASVMVRFDPGRLRQLLLNLLQNAEQACEGSGNIDVSIRQSAHRASLRIADNGTGIPEADRQRVFEPFYSTKKDGSGLGLPLIQRFVTEASGTVTCEENSPQGTVFQIDLPRVTRTEGHP